MAHPLLIMNTHDVFIAAVKKHLGVKKKKKKVKAKVKKKTKVKEPKIVLPPRESPFAVGDEAWMRRSGGEIYTKVKILKCIKPAIGFRAWSYETTTSTVDEEALLPNSIFSMIATDAVKLKVAHFNDALNETFDGEAVILAVLRQGQKRPWAYYIIPQMEIIKKKNEWKFKTYGYFEDRSAVLYLRPASKMSLRLLPISSAPNEILTYLGLHVYNRLWMKGQSE